jgi:hypothetical protein
MIKLARGATGDQFVAVSRNDFLILSYHALTLLIRKMFACYLSW